MEKSKWSHLVTCVIACLVLLAPAGCSSKGENSKEGKPTVQKQEVKPATSLPVSPPEAPVVQPVRSDNVAVEVDGAKLMKKDLDAEIKKTMASIKEKMPADRRRQIMANMRKQLRDNFIFRTLLTNETNRLKIAATDKEVNEAIDQIKATLPQGMTLNDFLKKNQLTKEKMRSEIAFRLKVNKLVVSQMGKMTKPTDKEITKFYKANKDKFKVPESVHVRHILIAKAPGDDETLKAAKKAKAEDLRKQILGGANFADIAAKNSDCPSKQSGGDLGTFTRGQMVKPFEDASFSQEINAIGPVLETEYGYHIIQVLERNGAKTMDLDKKTKERIAAFLTQQKQQGAFDAVLDGLKKKASIVVYEK